MKKQLMMIGVLLLLISGTVSAKGSSGVGLYGNLVGNGTGAGGGLGLTIKSGSFPVIGLEWYLMDHSSTFGGSMDWWIVNKPLAGIISYYMGLGGYAAIKSDDSHSQNGFNFGGRIPLGLQVFPIDPLELFIEVSPMIMFIPTINWTASVRLGFRVLF